MLGHIDGQSIVAIALFEPIAIACARIIEQVMDHAPKFIMDKLQSDRRLGIQSIINAQPCNPSPAHF